MYAKKIINKKLNRSYLPVKDSKEEWESYYLENLSQGVYGDEEDIELVENPDELKKIIREQVAEKGRFNREICASILEYVTGYNIVRNFPDELTQQMQERFNDIFTMLLAGRPYSALALIQIVEPDDIIVTQELKDECISIFKDNGFVISGN